MRPLFFFLIAVLTSLISYAQVPRQFAFQGVARNAANQPVANQTVSVRFTLRQGFESGTSVYQETHSPQTTAAGMFNLSVGAGNAVSGSFSAINWTAGPYFLQVELDAAGGSNYANINTTLLQSVPYAMAAKNLEGVTNPQDGDVMEYNDGAWIRKPKTKRFHFSGNGSALISTFWFVSAIATITIEKDNPNISLSATKTFGSNLSNGGESMSLVLGYRKVGPTQGDYTPFITTDVIDNFRVPTRVRLPFTLTGTYSTTFKAGEVYEVGMLGKSSNGASWNENGPSTGFVEVSY